MRRAFTHALIWLALAACFVSPIMQMFDHWDHEFQTGHDTESMVVVLALCVGVTFVLVQTISSVNQPSCSRRTETARSIFGGALQAIMPVADAAALFRSPLANLRI